MATVRGANAVALSTSAGTVSVTVPGATVDGDTGVLFHGYNQSTQDSPTPAGWTQIDEQTYSASFRIRTYKRSMLATDAGDPVTFTNTTIQRMAASLTVFAGTVDVDVLGALKETVSTATHAGATTPALNFLGVGLVAILERSSAPSGSTTAPSGFTGQPAGTAYGVGSGSVSVATAVKLTSTAAGATLGGGSWLMKDTSATTPTPNGAVVTFAVAIRETDPITQVGKTLTTTWNDRATVGNGFTGDVSDLFSVAGKATSWSISDISVAGRTLSTTWAIRKLVSAGASTTWNDEESPEVPPVDPGNPGDPGVFTKRVKFPTYKVPVGKGTLFSRFLIEQPQSLVKLNGEWFPITSPAQELLDTAEAYFIGGYSFLMTAADVLAYGLPPEFVEDIAS
jgi:hypothetical protein